MKKDQTKRGVEQARMKSPLRAAGGETAPETGQRTGRKMIPFPGVTISHDDFQSGFDGFLCEMGYIE